MILEKKLQFHTKLLLKNNINIFLQYERVVKNLKEKLKRIQGHAMSEVEHLKYKLIMERHEREKEQAEHSTATKYEYLFSELQIYVKVQNLISKYVCRELQKIVGNEQKVREQVESQLKEFKSSLSSKSQNRLLEAELDVLKNKLKQAEAVANKTPTMLLNLQTEMSLMRKKHRSAILEVISIDTFNDNCIKM